MQIEAIEAFAAQIPATFSERRGIYTVEFTVAERKAFLAKKKLTYSARFRIDDEKRDVRFTEMLMESGSGSFSGVDESSPGFGFRKETYKTGAGRRDGSIEEQSKLFGAQYGATFEFSKVRAFVEAEAVKAGYTFTVVATVLGV